MEGAFGVSFAEGFEGVPVELGEVGVSDVFFVGEEVGEEVPALLVWKPASGRGEVPTNELGGILCGEIDEFGEVLFVDLAIFGEGLYRPGADVFVGVVKGDTLVDTVEAASYVE